MPKQVVIVGRLAALSRAEAGQIVAHTGGVLSEHVTSNTALVVIGGRGPHFQQSGRVVVQFARARRLVQQGQALEICTEDEWLETVGLAAVGVRKRFTPGQVAEALNIPRGRIERWVAAGLLQPVEDSLGIPLFDFRQVAAARTIAELSRSGVRLAKVRRAVDQLARWLPEAGQSLAELSLSEDARRLMIRTPAGLWAEPTGQLLFDFDPDEDPAVFVLGISESQSEKFRRAVACEEDQPLEAAALYRELLGEYGPHPTIAFNLGNALYAADDVASALEFYRQATELAPQRPAAWNNLANVLAELDQLEEALDAYRRALALDARLADARFNLAQTLEELGRRAEAVLHWRAYLAADPESTWADYARERLEQA